MSAASKRRFLDMSRIATEFQLVYDQSEMYRHAGSEGWYISYNDMRQTCKLQLGVYPVHVRSPRSWLRIFPALQVVKIARGSIPDIDTRLHKPGYYIPLI